MRKCSRIEILVLFVLFCLGLTCTGVMAEEIEYWLKEAEKGNPASQYNLGMIYYNGNIVPQDYSKARVYFQQAAECNSNDSAGYLTKITEIEEAYQIGFEAFLACDYETALEKLQFGADNGYNEALLCLGCMYFIGNGVEQNIEKGLELFEQAASLGNIAACESLAELYGDLIDEESKELGIIVEPDLEKSCAYFQKAQELRLLKQTTEKEQLDYLAFPYPE